MRSNKVTRVIFAVILFLVLALAGCANVTVNPTPTMTTQPAVTPSPTTTALASTSTTQPADAVQSEVDAANKELRNLKTAILAYYADNGQWPSDTTVLGKYLTAAPYENYNVDQQDGYILTLYGSQNWPGIVFHPGVAGAGGRDGFWAKN